MSKVMAATGLEKGGYLPPFSSKQELAGGAFDSAWEVALDPKDATLVTKFPTASLKLKSLFAKLRQRAPIHFLVGCPLLNTALAADERQSSPARTGRKHARNGVSVTSDFHHSYWNKPKELRRSMMQRNG